MFARWAVRKESVMSQLEFAKRFCQLLDTYPDIGNPSSAVITDDDKNKNGKEEKHRVLSDSTYLSHLTQMARLHPGACFIWIHRNVKYTLGYRSTPTILSKRGGGGRQHKVERNVAGTVIQEATMAHAKGGLDARSELSSSNPITDFYFEDLLDDPIAAVRRLYAVLRRGEVSTAFEEAMRTGWELNERSVKEDFACNTAIGDVSKANEYMKVYVERFPKAKAV